MTDALPPLAGIPPPRVKFTRQDAAGISALVNRAPLRNMQEAGHVAQLLMRFEQWVIQQGAITPDLPNQAQAGQAPPPGADASADEKPPADVPAGNDIAEQTGEASPQS